MGAQKFKKANTSINKALEINPDDPEYESLKNLIEQRKN
jgi:Flp pilus assembly protein TadD